MKGFFIGLSVAVAFVLGILASNLLIPKAEAQNVTRQQYSECFSATLNSQPGQSLKKALRPSHTIHIPPGWTPIGVIGPARTKGIGTTTSGGGLIVLCR